MRRGRPATTPHSEPEGFPVKFSWETTVVINGKEHPLGHTDKEKAIADFKKALEGKPKAQAVISSLMQQGSAVRIMRLQSKTPTAPTDTRPNPPPS